MPRRLGWLWVYRLYAGVVGRPKAPHDGCNERARLLVAFNPASPNQRESGSAPSTTGDMPSVVHLPLLVADPGSDLGAGGEAELGEDVLDVGLGGAGRDHEGLGNLLVTEALVDQFRDLALSTGQDRRS